MQTFCQAHSEEIELVCNHPACSSPFLCLLCFQDHSNSCSANFKTDIKKVRHVAQDQQWIQTHEQKRKTIISQIEEICQQRREVHSENQKVVNEKFNQILNFLEIKYCVWSESLLGMTEHTSNHETHQIFNKLTDHLETLKTLNLNHESHIVKVQSARNLEVSVFPEVSRLIEQGRNSMEQWRLCQTKMESYKSQVIDFVQNMDLKACIGPQQHQNVGRIETGNRETQALQAANNSLQQEIQQILRSKSELQNQVETLTAQNRALKAQNTILAAKSETTTEAGSIDEEAGRAKFNIEELNYKIDSLNNQVLSIKSFINANQNQRPAVTQESTVVQIQRQQEVLREVSRLTPAPVHVHKPVQQQIDYLAERKVVHVEEDFLAEKKIIVQQQIQRKPAQSYAIEVDTRTRIITTEAYENLSTWIPRPAGARQTDKCKLNLIYQASTHGFAAKDFHGKCDDVGTTISFIKTKEHGRIFGGYTTKNWNAQGDCQWVEDREAFIFSLSHGQKFACAKPQYAIYAGKSNLISFGKGLDIGIRSNAHVNKSNAWTNFPNSYRCEQFCDSVESREAATYLAGSTNFLVEEIEVYQVSWN